jgi:hypothetical protein
MKAEAANLTYIKDTLSNSAPSETSNHTIQFLSPTGVGNNETVTVAFPSGFGTSSIVFTDVDLEINGVDETIDNGAPDPGEWGFSWSGNTMVLTAAANESIAAGATTTIKIGTNADGGTNMVTNHSATSSYEFTVTAGSADNGQFRVAIIDDVLVTANVNTTLTFTVYGTTTGAVMNGSDPADYDSTSITLPFGTLNANDPVTLGQDLTVSTNARNGYVVTVEQDANLLSSTGADIDGFIDGAYTDTPSPWQAPSNNIASENTWGHWGLTSSDTDLLGAGADFGSDEWIAASTTPRAIMAHNGPADGTTQDIGRASIGYAVEITSLQEAGDDYSTTLTYIATPTF